MVREYETPMSIANKRHDVVGLHIYDEAEKSLPKVGIINAVDAETGREILFDSSSKQLRNKYEGWYKQNLSYFSEVFRKNKADVLSISTNGDYVKALLQFFKSRAK